MKRLLRHLQKIKKQDQASSWKLTYEQFKPAQEGLREALCTLGNGYFGTRGAACESAASRIHYPGTYIAGVYNKLATHIAAQTVFNEDLINCPNWLFLSFRFGNRHWFKPAREKILSYNQELDMHKGMLTRKIYFQDDKDRRVRIETQRIVHMSNPHRAAMRYLITTENYEGPMMIRSGLDGTVQNSGVARYKRLNSRHLKAHKLGTFANNGVYLSMKTSQSRIEICEAAKVHIFSDKKEIRPKINITNRQNKAIFQDFKIFVRKNHHYEIEKIVAIYTSKDNGLQSPLDAAINSVKSANRFEALVKTHKLTWGRLWRRFDIQIAGDIFSQRVLRLHIFHLLQTASIHNAMLDAGIPARGLHGEAYRGHVFWDTLFVTPFFDFHQPEISGALFSYRYRRLAQACKNAHQNWYRGAMFPWQSGSSGEEETPLIHLNPLSGKWGPDFSHQQKHASFAIAYNVWQHWKITADLSFLIQGGAEMILSIARFGASLVQYSSRDQRYHTEGLMGPDEFHEKLPAATKAGFKDNAYTNLLIVWTLLKAKETLSLLPEYHRMHIIKKLKLSSRELSRWEYIMRKMNIVFNKDGIIAQFDGYFELKELNWKAYKAKYGNIHRIDRILKAEGKSPNEYKVAKQADVLMTFYLFSLAEIKDLFHHLGYRFNKNMLKRNYEYYIRRTSHGSTLSKVVHCYLAYLLGRSRNGRQWFLDVLKSDIYDTQGGTTPEGIHVGVMGGSFNIVLRIFAGINLIGEQIKINPNLPKHWRHLKLRVRFRDKWISLYVTKSQIKIIIRGPKSKQRVVSIVIQNKIYYLHFGKTYKIRLKKGIGL